MQNHTENRQVFALTGEKLNAACFNTPSSRDYCRNVAMNALYDSISSGIPQVPAA